MSPARIVVALLAATLTACTERDMQPNTDTAVEKARPAVVRTHERAGRITRLYGAPLVPADAARTGAAQTAGTHASAEAVVAKYAEALGAQPDELVLDGAATAPGATPSVPPKAPASPAASTAQQLMYDRAAGRYRFSLYRYAQRRDGVAVFGAQLGVVVRNEPPFAAVLAASTLKDLRGFRPPARHRRTLDRRKANAAVRAIRDRTDFQGKLIAPADPLLHAFSEPEVVVWAGTDDAPALPRLAVTFVGDNDGHPGAKRRERWRFVADADTGDILHQENLIAYDVSGNVSGKVTASAREMRCDPEVTTPFPYADARVQGGNAAIANAAGNFVIAHGGMAAVTVESPVSGKHFQVFDAVAARDELLSLMVTPPGPANFVHNAPGTDEFLTGQANGYANANAVRDWVLLHHPSFPDVPAQVDFPVRVNLTDSICPGNAWYDGASLNFCASFNHPSPAKDDYGNTSFASVAQHEYGHHLVEVAGSGQGEYGEGMGDVVAMLLADDPRLGLGFFMNECDTALRNADNTCQYAAAPTCSSCGSEIHACGKLLSGAIWDLREALGVSDPPNALDITSNLAINSILLHTGTAIDAQITIDFLTLDDDDDNIDNGTPHSTEICSAFGSHGLGCPPAALGLTVSPTSDFAAAGAEGGPFTPSNKTYTVENLGPGALDYAVTTAAGWLTLTNATGSLANGATASVGVQIDVDANALPKGVHTATLTFTNTTSGVGNTTRAVTLEIGRAVVYLRNFDTNPGWTTQGGWAFGVPLGGGGTIGDDNWGSPDPTSGYTGANVYGYDLAGNYPNSLTQQHLTTTAIDLSDVTGVKLKFRRWLCLEGSQYDHAYVRVSTNGTSWTDLWQNTRTLNGGYWTTEEIDIPAANLQPTVYLRWTMGTADAAWRYCGWNLDDVEISGFAVPQCTVPADCDDGLACNGTEGCASGSCTPGTPMACADSIACTVDACNEATDACTHTPSNAACDNAVFCDGVEICNAVSGCGAGAPRDCDDGVACTADSCDEMNDACVHTPNAGACDDGLFCNGVESCHPTLNCLPNLVDPCADAVGCTTDACVEATDSCSYTPSNAACDNALYCDGVETCHVTLGCQDQADPNCADAVACTTDACVEASDSCSHTPSNAACDNTLYCDGVETCHMTLGCQDQADPNCADAVACTTDSCNEGTNSCDHAPSNVACDNTLYCDGVETCHLTLGCQDQADPNCADAVACTTDACVEATDSCSHTPSNAACDNTLYCDGVETCHITLGCQDQADPNCADAVACTTDACVEATDSCSHMPSNAACDNALYCDGSETCHVTLGCQDQADPNCADAVACTTDSCNEGTNSCDHAPSNVACDNTLYCDGVETCHLTLGCQDQADPNCADAVACTTDACVEATDSCSHTPSNAACDNTLYCDGVETCHITLGCQDQADPNCADAVACTTDACVEGTDSCSHTPSSAACDNTLYCDGVETCHVTLGCQDAANPNCADAVGCTTDSCNEGTDSCDHAPSNAACDNTLYCDGVETCHITLGCQDQADPNCADAVACTTDACVEATDSCSHTPSNAACDNTLYCDGVETCHITLGCQDQADPNCADAVACTTDACVEATDSCSHTPSNAACDNALYCDGVETCHVTLGCQDAADPSCADAVACTTDSCNEGTDSCDHAPSNAACDNTVYCDGSETCHITLGCQDAADPSCADAVACTTDSCNEGTDSCNHTPSNAACDNTLYCDGSETCHITLGCQDQADPNCADAVGCTTDSCNEGTDSCDHAPSNAACDNTLYCDGVETCHVTLGCQDAVDPNCADAVACTTDACVEATDSCSHTPSNAACDNTLYCDGSETCDSSLDCQSGTDPCVGLICDEAGDACMLPAVDAGTPVDAGAPVDAAAPLDAATPAIDAAGTGDDAGAIDAGPGTDSRDGAVPPAAPPDVEAPTVGPDPGQPQAGAGPTPAPKHDGGGQVEDAGDAGTSAIPSSGCGCRTAGGQSQVPVGHWFVVGWLVIATAVWRRHRRRALSVPRYARPVRDAAAN